MKMKLELYEAVESDSSPLVGLSRAPLEPLWTRALTALLAACRAFFGSSFRVSEFVGVFVSGPGPASPLAMGKGILHIGRTLESKFRDFSSFLDYILKFDDEMKFSKK